MPTLKSQIEAIANTLAAGILEAVRSASLAEILGDGASSAAPTAAKRGRGRPKKAAGGGGMPDPLKTSTKAKRGKGGRLLRRSPEEITKVIGLVVDYLKKNTRGLRSEQLQKALKLDKKEIAGPLTQALSEKKITKKGERRSTTYFAK